MHAECIARESLTWMHFKLSIHNPCLYHIAEVT